MNNKTIYILIVILIFGGLLGYRFLTYPIGLTSDDFKKVYKSGDAATQENYSKQCQAEFDSNLLFPLGQVSKAVFCKGFFSLDRTLSTDKTKRLLEIINDSASYVWGEVGTFISDRAIVFYNNENKPLGIIELEEEGGRQSYSYPYLRRTKWGALSNKAMNEINALTNE